MRPERTASAESQAQAPYPAARIAWTAVAVLMVLSVFALLDRQILSLMVNMIRADFGVSDTKMGLLQGAAFAVILTLAAFPFGWATDRYPRRIVLFIGVFAWAVAATACGLATSFNTLLAARLGVGLGEAALSPVVASMIADLFPKRRLSTALAVVSLGQSLGTQGALIIGGAVLYWAGDGLTFPLLGFLAPWKVAFIVTGAPGLLLAFIIFLIPEPKRHGVSQAFATSRVTWAEALPFLRQHKGFLSCYIGGFAALSIATTGLMAWGPTAFQRVYGLSPGDTGVLLGGFSLACAMVGTMAAGLFTDRLYARGRRSAHSTVYAWTGAVAIVVGLATAYAPSPWMYLLILAPLKLMSNFSGVATAGLLVMTPAHLRGRMQAIYVFAVVFLGATVGPSAVPFFTDVVFKDDMKILWSISATVVCFGAIAAVLLGAAARIVSRTPAADLAAD